ncbi:hypothetical protein [Qipengyuania nanhaisediminis]|uniref:capsular polysaccharide export protein, LipB/KpsS family n=1 Tax=Qipengyuania nanhaisediminis TaxID=604088 RepID=UPI0038B36AB8
MQSLIISTLAEYQTRFWVPVGRALERRGLAVTFVSCDTLSTRMLAEAGLDVIDMTRSARLAALGSSDPEAVCTAFGIANPGPLLVHEKFAFAARDTAALLRKFAGGLLVAEQAIARARAKGDPIAVQELGGFVSVTALHHAARGAGIDSHFIEPSFFTGRMQIVTNTLGALSLPGDARAPVSAAQADYFESAVARGTVVIPQKDRHHYAGAAKKLLNPHNIKRLIEKTRDKHLLGAEQEFGAIGHHVATHLRMLASTARMRGHYSDLARLGRFIYYPLHVPGDVALTMRSREYCDQLALLDYLCRIAPPDMVIATKEHPAMIGAVPARGLLALKKRYDRLSIIAPTTNNYAVLRAAEKIVTVNSKSGAEAGLLGREVIVLGDAFYREAPFVRAVDRLCELETAIVEPPLACDEDATRGFFAALWHRTRPGELYANDGDNIATFTGSLIALLHPEARPAIREPAALMA